MKKKPETYSKDSVKVLDDIEHIRLRPGMYVGGTDQAAYYHIAKEIYDNSFDEALAGHATKIRITLDDDARGMSVIDDGRGVPHEKNDKTGLSTLATVFMIARSGAKFESLTYSTSVGLHGVGATATNALSETFEAKSFRKGKVAHVKFKQGIISAETPDAVISPNTTKLKNGTLVHFRPDRKIWADLSYDPSVLGTKLKDTSFLLPGVKIEFLEKPTATPLIFQSKAGLPGMLEAKTAGLKLGLAPYSGTIKFKTTVGDIQKDAEADICFSWVEGDENAGIYSFVNLSETPDGGTHANGLERGIGKALLALAKDKCTVNELSRGLRAIIHVRHPGPQFNNQTKPKLTNSDLTSTVSDLVEAVTLKFARANKPWFDAFIKDSIDTYEQKMSDKDLKKALKGLKKVNKSTKGVLPSKLYEVDCAPHLRELFLVEGDSAMGSCVDARDAGFQEVLALRGKVVNVLRTDLSDALQNKEISNIVTAIGAGVGPAFDLKKCRVGRVILLTDADVDGEHIASLLTTFFVEHMRPLVEDGRLFLVDSPLFQASVPNSHTRFYAHTFEELKLKAGKQFSKCELSRLKGHGEANADAVAEYAMKPGTRKLINVTVDLASKAKLHAIMADDATARKKLLGF